MQQLLLEPWWYVGNHMLESYFPRDSKFWSNAVRKGMSCHWPLFSDTVAGEGRGLLMLPALSPLASSRPLVRDRNCTATSCSLLLTETRAKTGKNEAPIDKYFVDLLWFRQNLCDFSFWFQVCRCLGSAADISLSSFGTVFSDAHPLLVAHQPMECVCLLLLWYTDDLVQDLG